MTQPQDRVYLPITISRCLRQQVCMKAAGCARDMLKHEIGRPTEDMTRTAGWTSESGCSYRIDAHFFRKPPSAGAAPAKEYVKGLL